MRSLVFALVCASAAFAQQNTDVTITEQRSRLAMTTLDFYDGSGNQIYECQAFSNQPTFTLTLTNIVVSSNVATVTTPANHGLQVGNQVIVTGSATSGVNGTFIIASVPSTTTFTYSDTVANGTYTDATMTTTAPRSNAAVWSIYKQTYSGSTRTLKQWAQNQGTGYTNVCDNRTTVAYQ